VAAIDSILGIVRQQGANELRVGVGREPRMFAWGEPKRLSIPATAEQTLRSLLGEILSAEREQQMRARGSAATIYETASHGAFQVTLTASAEGGFDALFVSIDDLAEHEATPVAAPSVVVGAASKSATAPTGEIAARLPERAQPRQPRAAAPLTEWVRRATAMRASDLHLAEGECPAVRVDGVLERLDGEVIGDLAVALPFDAATAARIGRGESIDLALEIPGVGRLRAHVYPSASGPIAALRLLPRAAPSFASLNMPFAFDDLVDLPHGLVLVCGAAGSGKSTTLAALAQEALRRRSRVLVTLEDPIEYVLTGSDTSLVRRRQIGRDVSDFATGLRDALRADPDMLLLGEIRDPESIALALTAAETGHLVLASMHSGSTASAVERIVDSCPAGRQQQIRLQLAESLRAVVAQRLLPRVHGEGRLPAIEVLRVTRAVASLIREGKTAQFATVLQSGRREGMLSLERSLADRVQAGEIRQEDAYAAANDPESLAIFLARK
jgi:twitching motility protein PilT